MYVPEFWVGFACCIALECIGVFAAAAIKSFKEGCNFEDTQEYDDGEDKS